MIKERPILYDINLTQKDDFQQHGDPGGQKNSIVACTNDLERMDYDDLTWKTC